MMRIGAARTALFTFDPSGVLAARRAVASSAGTSTFGSSQDDAPNRPLFSVERSSLAAANRLTVAGSNGPGDRINSLLRDLRSLVAAAPSYTPAPAAQNGSGSLTVARVPATISLSKSIPRTQVWGVNPSQVAGVQFGRLLPGERISLQGEVTRRAAAATLTIRGDAGGRATAGGTYELSGNRGSAALVVTAGESLAALGQRINDQTALTGVEAEAGGNDLVLRSIDVGAASQVQLGPVEAEYALNINGVDPQQLARFDVTSFQSGGAETINGRLVSGVQGAEVVYHGGNGSVVAGTASFRLTGSRGGVDIALVEGESLAAVAQRINQSTFSTGVRAAVDGNDLRLSSDTVGASARVQVSDVQREYDTTVSGVNATQIADVSVTALETGSQHVLAGHVTRSASRAELFLQGSAGGTVIDSATSELRGSLGNAELSITQGESLSAVADRVNALSGDTGVTAAVVGNQLRFSSSDVGSSAEVEVDLLHVAHTTSVSGVNNQQLTAFQVNDFTDGASRTLSGSITQTASKAQLTFTGTFLSTIGSNATIRINGSQGSVQLSVTSFQSVSSLATQVNQNTGTTGVTATVQGNKIHFRSASVGSAAVVDIDVLSGTFNVTGGNGQGTANGTNAVAVVNGQTITGAGNQFQFTDSVGTYSFTSVSGFTGGFSPVSIVSQAGSFELTGGNGDGTASGLDGLATINGIELTGVKNRFAIGEPGGEFELEFASGFTGQFDPVTIASTPDPFEISGGDGAGTSLGNDARAIFNGAEQTSANGRFTVQGAQGTYAVEFAGGFSGDFDPITVTSTPQLLVIEGGDEVGRDTGDDAKAVINGRTLIGAGAAFRFIEAGREVSLNFQPDFQGTFDTIEAIGIERTVQDLVRLSIPTVQRASEPSGVGSRSISPFDAVLDELNALLNARDDSALDSRGSASIDSAKQPTRAAIVSQQFTLYSRQNPAALAYSLDPLLLNSPKQMRNLVDFLA